MRFTSSTSDGATTSDCSRASSAPPSVGFGMGISSGGAAGVAWVAWGPSLLVASLPPSTITDAGVDVGLSLDAFDQLPCNIWYSQRAFTPWLSGILWVVPGHLTRAIFPVCRAPMMLECECHHQARPR